MFGKKQLSEEIVASMYRPVITPANVAGQMTLMRLKINKAGENETNFLMKTDSGTRKAEVEEVTNRTEGMAIVKPHLWVAGKQCRFMLTATDVLVFPPVCLDAPCASQPAIHFPTSLAFLFSLLLRAATNDTRVAWLKSYTYGTS